MLMRNRDGEIILVAGRGDWANPTGQTKITLQLDDAPPQELDASVFDNLVLSAIKDAALSDRLMHAGRLRWHLPWGDFRADIAGLSVAAEALRACDLRKKAAPGSH